MASDILSSMDICALCCWQPSLFLPNGTLSHFVWRRSHVVICGRKFVVCLHNYGLQGYAVISSTSILQSRIRDNDHAWLFGTCDIAILKGLRLVFRIRLRMSFPSPICGTSAFRAIQRSVVGFAINSRKYTICLSLILLPFFLRQLYFVFTIFAFPFHSFSLLQLLLYKFTIRGCERKYVLCLRSQASARWIVALSFFAFPFWRPFLFCRPFSSRYDSPWPVAQIYYWCAS